MFERENAPKVLTEEQLETIHEQAMRILEEIGTDVLHDEALKLLADAGMTLDGDRVRWDRGFVMEQVAKAPASFRLRARNPERSLTVGEGAPVCMNVGGPPFASDLDEGRRSGRLQDHDTLVKMTQATDLLTCVQIGAVEAVDLEVEHRHMDMEYSVHPLVGQAVHHYGTSGPKARDALELGAIVFGGHEAIAEMPALLGIVNPNSPLIWDFRMTDALMVWAEANQPIVVTPFLLAGGTSPVSVGGALSIQVAEALSGVAIAQTVRPGAPCMYGSFFTALDMRTGSPAFGTPESVFGVLAGGQLARRYGLPFRGGGGLASSNGGGRAGGGRDPDDAVGHDARGHRPGAARGRLARGRPHRVVREVRTGRGAAEACSGACARASPSASEELAFDAIAEMGPGGLFLASEHTMEHFKEWLYMSPLFQTPDFATWESQGSPTLEQNANAAWKKLLESYEDPGLDPAIDEELQEYMAKRRLDPVVEED